MGKTADDRMERQYMRKKNMRMVIHKGAAKITALLLIGLFLAGGLCACGWQGKGNTKIILTAGFSKNEVFRIDSVSCSKSELMVYLTNTQNQYENVFGEEIWQKNFGDVTLEENVKETVLARIARVKSMTLLAKEQGVALTQEEIDLCTAAAQEYYGSLSGQEIALLEVTPEQIASMYQDYALADKVYHYIIRDINPEISDDVARTIILQHILLKTYTQNAQGTRAPMSEEEKRERYELALELRGRLDQGEDFEILMELYNEAEENTLAIRHGETESSFEEAAFGLAGGEISEIVETEEGYQIIKCISTFDREQTDANKLEIVRERREQVFGEQYEDFVSGLTKQLNEKLWDEISLIHDKEITTTSFFDVYNRFFAEEE